MQKAVMLFFIGVLISVCPSNVQGISGSSCTLRIKGGTDVDVTDTVITQCSDCFTACTTTSVHSQPCKYYRFTSATVDSLFIPIAFMCPPVSLGVATQTRCDSYGGPRGSTLLSIVPAANCADCQNFCASDSYCQNFDFHDGGFSTGPTDFNVPPSFCSSFAAGVGDPHFSGFNGSPFEFHGHDGAFVNIYSDASLQLNAELSSFGIHGKTFMKSLGMKTYPPCNSFRFTSVPTVENSTWIARVESHANGKLFDESNGAWKSEEGGISLKQIPTTDGSFEIMLRTHSHLIRVHKERTSLHLDLGMKLLTAVAPLRAHGILGQTLGWTAGGKASLAGDESSYITTGIFEDDFAFNMFHAICG